MAHIIAIVAFGIAFMLNKGDHATAVEIGANWGFWIMIILGGILATLHFIITVIAGITGAGGGGSIGGDVGGNTGCLIGAFIGGLAGSGLALILAIFNIAQVGIGAYGYHQIRLWGSSNLTNEKALTNGAIFLGLSLLIMIINKTSSSAKKSSN